VLGRFQLGNIRPAARGEPQIEVTLDVDANGILNVTARDSDTGAQQGITISESSNLDRGEVDRMITEAERNRAEDQALRQGVDARNELDAITYRVERTLQELGDQAPTHERARAEQLVADARQALKEEAPPDRVRALTSDLQQVDQGLRARGGAAAGAPGGGPQPGGPQPGQGGDEDVIDADFTREDGSS
jgi:molecular chaperone DnaK